MKCPNCGAEDPAPESTDNDTTTCPRCGHRFPIDFESNPELEPVGAVTADR